MNQAPNMLTCCERWLLGLSGFGMFGLSVLAWLNPAMRTVASAQASGQSTILISSEPSSIVLALLAFGSLLLFIAVNGRRISNLKLPGGAEFTSAIEQETKAAVTALTPKVGEISGTGTDSHGNAQVGTSPGTNSSARSDTASQPQGTPSKTTQVNGVELGVYALDAVPVRVLRDLLDKMPESELPQLFAVEFVARRSGRGNHPWLIKFRAEEKIWKVAYGGHGKVDPSVSAL